jgi:flagellar secretion chaperone FliS
MCFLRKKVLYFCQLWTIHNAGADFVALYDQYLEQSILTASPLELVRTVYRLILENVRSAGKCIDSGDIMGRGKAVTKATDGILELLTSLNHQDGGAISKNLAELYSYMASRLLQGHMDQDRAPFDEVEKLVSTLLDAWETMESSETAAAADALYGSIPESYIPVSANF